MNVLWLSRRRRAPGPYQPHSINAVKVAAAKMDATSVTRRNDLGPYALSKSTPMISGTIISPSAAPTTIKLATLLH
jgi:hypothetical protein